MLADPPGVSDSEFTPPVGFFIWVAVVAASPFVLCYLFFVVREMVRDWKARASRKDSPGPPPAGTDS